MCFVYKILYLNTLSIRFNNEEGEEMCKDFLILLGIKKLRTYQKEVRKSYQICFVKNKCFIKILYLKNM